MFIQSNIETLITVLNLHIKVIFYEQKYFVTNWFLLKPFKKLYKIAEETMNFIKLKTLESGNMFFAMKHVSFIFVMLKKVAECSKSFQIWNNTCFFARNNKPIVYLLHTVTKSNYLVQGDCRNYRTGLLSTGFCSAPVTWMMGRWVGLNSCELPFH